MVDATPWQRILQTAIDRRRFLHQCPELRWEERETANTIREALTELNIPWRACADTGTVGTIAPDRVGPHLAFRADMDALPIEEASGVPYASRVPGVMHACGHDGHMATLLAAGAWFQLHAELLPGPVSLVFQPAEEGGHGAAKMIEASALEGVDCIYGWHNWPSLPLGRALCPAGTVMSGNGTFRIELKGRGGHASQPEETRDPVLAAAAVILNLQQIVSRRLPPQADVVVSVTSVDARSGLTVTPERAVLEGSIRFSLPRWREPVFQLIEEISRNTAASYGVEAEIFPAPRYDPTINHPEPALQYRSALKEDFGPRVDETDLMLPIMASEDFGEYLKRIPGAFALVGISQDDPEFGTLYGESCHSPYYGFNDAVIAPVVRVFSRLAGVPPPGEDDA
ncbi:MAG: N(2)-acetyl-L-2,4-diaminobutanoate deacetylase DoeB2 [Verrucomicrobia bacterium]|nr:N(2)-acetyl-L-2,4-diaminobutanoate deacetylase DoeB2 [Verrucomicrobiota bacterium]MCH8513261.1 N(2)-acetyl-L-2,4-diaminobutanoate deacetylase DoeB2 [Kiritimatiellia bacterium]